MKIVLPILAAAMVAVSVYAEVSTEKIEYKHDDVKLEGFWALPQIDKNAGAAPCVLVVPDWKGPSDYYRNVAKDLAGNGYAAFVVDMYGKDVRPKTKKEAGALSKKYKNDRKLMRERIQAALKTAQGKKEVDGKKIGAIGYCFGGTVVLELARSGADVSGVVSFHGGLGTPAPKDAENINGKVLVLHGADDPLVPPEEVAAFQKEMRDAKVDWQMNSYGNAVHSFTKKSAGNDNSKGVAYNDKAAKRSWKEMKRFFLELFDSKPSNDK